MPYSLSTFSLLNNNWFIILNIQFFVYFIQREILGGKKCRVSTACHSKLWLPIPQQTTTGENEETKSGSSSLEKERHGRPCCGTFLLLLASSFLFFQQQITCQEKQKKKKQKERVQQPLGFTHTQIVKGKKNSHLAPLSTGKMCIYPSQISCRVVGISFLPPSSPLPASFVIFSRPSTLPLDGIW